MTGGLFHVISRFHDRRFYLDIDGAREKYLETLGNALETHDSRVIAYCLMSSHVHLVLQLGNDPLGALTKKVHSPFASGDVELSYPILGPDEFVVYALKEQVRRHRNRRRIQTVGGEFSRLTKKVFENLDLDPGLAKERVRGRKVSRGRALAAYLWVERMGGPQGIVASEFGVSPAAVTLMLNKLRRDGLREKGCGS